jgi:hypothetical protein
VLALDVVKVQPGADTGLGLGYIRIGMEVDLLVFEAAPQSLDKDVVHALQLADLPVQKVDLGVIAGSLRRRTTLEDARRGTVNLAGLAALARTDRGE